MKEIVFLKSSKDEPFTTSDIIAEATGNNYRSVQRIIERQKHRLEVFGAMKKQYVLTSKNQNKIVYILNAKQTILLLSMIGNSEPAISAKIEAISALFDGRKPEFSINRKNTKSLYIIERDNSKIKIGISQNPKKRLRAIETQGGFSKTNCFVTKPFNDAEEFEKICHKILKNFHISGEWFEIDFNSAKNLLPKCIFELN